VSLVLSSLQRILHDFFYCREFFTNSKTNEFYEEGEILKNPKLAETLKIISREGSDSFYSPTGTFTKTIVEEIRSNGGIITLEDLTTYQPKWGKPVESKLFNGQTLYTYPLPGTGHIITFILNTLSGYKLQEHHKEDKLYYHRLIETFKFAFAKRSKLGDEMTDEVIETLKQLESLEHAEMIRQRIDDEKTYNDYTHYGANTTNVEDHGTGHISIMAANGDAVSLTSTINGV
jgi:gamma-glutamyltranspeptidase / glutathione hydrolase / leukotriene-C4 hydrolase